MRGSRLVADSSVLVINTSSTAVNHFAAAIASLGLLGTYVRPYANLGRQWESILSGTPVVGRSYAQLLGRRQLPAPLTQRHVAEVARWHDLLLAVQRRLAPNHGVSRALRRDLIRRINTIVANEGARRITNEAVVVASWWVALPAFQRALRVGATRVLSYPLAHHEFTQRYLEEEARLQPAFRETLNSHDLSPLEATSLDREIELADYVVVGSTFVKSTFVDAGVPEEKVVVIPYGVDVDRFAPPEFRTPSRSGAHFVFAGQVGQRKGISYLLGAFERLRCSDVRLTLIGAMQGNGIALAPFQGMVQHIPHVPQTELAQWFRNADVFVFPTLVEGMPLVVVEAMACGLPVITTPHGSSDIVRDGVDGFLVPPREIVLLSERMERLARDPDLRRWMAANAVQRAQEFTWGAYQSRASRLITQILDARSK